MPRAVGLPGCVALYPLLACLVRGECLAAGRLAGLLELRKSNKKWIVGIQAKVLATSCLNVYTHLRLNAGRFLVSPAIDQESFVSEEEATQNET